MNERRRSVTRAAHRPERPAADERGRYVMQREWIRAEQVINAGLIVVGVYVVQALLATGVADLPARVSIVGWAAAIPLLAGLAMLNLVRESYRYASFPLYWKIASAIAEGSALVGFVAAFWHIWFPAAIVATVSGAGGIALYQIYLRRLELDNAPPH